MRIPFGTITVTDKSKKLICEALETTRLSSGKYVKEFERKFADKVGTKYAVAVSTGTDAVALALAVLYDYGAKRGDEVIVPALSFVASGNAVLQAGFTPVFVDINVKTLNIDPTKIEEAITEKTKAILPVHLMGKPAEMDAIKDIANRHNLYIIEDAAEAHGAEYKGAKIGTIGHMAAYSLYIAHIITTIEGGIVTTDDEEFAGIIRSLRSHGRACKCESCVLNTSSAYCKKRFENSDKGDIRFVFERIGFSSKMNELEAAVGLGSLDDYEKILNVRRNNLYYLIKEFKRFTPFLTTFKKEKYEEIGPHAFPIFVNSEAPFSRNELVEYLENNGIDTRNLFFSMPTQCSGFSFLGHKEGQFPSAEYIGRQGLHIGVHQDLGEKECDYIINTIKTFLSQY